ncbi:MAG: hypothetical protein FWC47_17300 [Oscillospiraceae bacterium]|nr:hypothetical protein [Oscillospiraceae bacterium]
MKIKRIFIFIVIIAVSLTTIVYFNNNVASANISDTNTTNNSLNTLNTEADLDTTNNSLTKEIDLTKPGSERDKALKEIENLKKEKEKLEKENEKDKEKIKKIVNKISELEIATDTYDYRFELEVQLGTLDAVIWDNDNIGKQYLESLSKEDQMKMIELKKLQEKYCNVLDQNYDNKTLKQILDNYSKDFDAIVQKYN